MERTVRPLILTWLALLLLLAASAGTARLPLGWLNNVISLAIAIVKTLLVALVFMRLRRSPWLLRLAAMAGIFMLALLFALSATDYATRGPAQAPWQRPGAVAPRLGSSSVDTPPVEPVPPRPGDSTADAPSAGLHGG